MYTREVNSILDLISLPIIDFVEESYRILLNRLPHPQEKTERAGALRAGLGRIRFLSDMTRSPEYRQRCEHMLYTADNAAFVHVLFHNYLNRVPDSDGLQHYAGLLEGGRPRARVMRDIARSREARFKRTLWYELEHLITIDRAEQHWLRRWFGHSTRQRKLLNLGHEALLQHNLMHTMVAQHLRAEVAHTTLNPSAPDNAAFLHMDSQNQSHDIRRVITRLRHVAGSL